MESCWDLLKETSGSIGNKTRVSQLPAQSSPIFLSRCTHLFQGWGVTVKATSTRCSCPSPGLMLLQEKGQLKKKGSPLIARGGDRSQSVPGLEGGSLLLLRLGQIGSFFFLLNAMREKEAGGGKKGRRGRRRGRKNPFLQRMEWGDHSLEPEYVSHPSSSLEHSHRPSPDHHHFLPGL